MHVSLYSKTTMCVSTPNMFATKSMPRNSIRRIANLAFNLPPPDIPTRTVAMSKHGMANLRSVSGNSLSTLAITCSATFRNRPAADLSSTPEDAPVTKLLLHVTRDKLKTHAMFPEVAANGWYV